MPTATEPRVSRNAQVNASQTRRRNVERDLVIPDVVDQARRDQLAADDAEWLRVYFSDVFYSPFTEAHLEIIADVGESLRYGTSKCKAAPRGYGKSSIVKYLMVKYALCRQVRFPLVIAATFGKAMKTTSSRTENST